MEDIVTPLNRFEWGKQTSLKYKGITRTDLYEDNQFDK